MILHSEDKMFIQSQKYLKMYAGYVKVGMNNNLDFQSLNNLTNLKNWFIFILIFSYLNQD